MTMEIKMLKAIADAALEMAMAMQAVVDDCAAQLAARKATGEDNKGIRAEPFAKAGQQDKANRETQDAPEPSAGTAPVPDEQKITLVELRAFVAGKSTPENRPVIKEILARHGVKKLTELKEEQYRSVMEAVGKACP